MVTGKRMSYWKKEGRSEKAFVLTNAAVLVLLTVTFLYPLWHVFMASFSNPPELLAHIGPIWKPLGLSLAGYNAVLHNRNILIGYGNTVFYVALGTGLNLVMTILGAYVLSRRNLRIKKPLTLFIIITMYVHAGIIPDFLLIRYIGLYDSRMAIILPGVIGTWNLIVMRTCFTQIPRSLEESAQIDGAGDFTVLLKIILPVAKATIMVMLLFYAVGHWNSWFSAVIYLKDRAKYPLQLFLREILLMNSVIDPALGADATTSDFFTLAEVIKNASIVVSTLPILLIYPLVQKYFIVGVMLGSLKE
jgi:putative aldouronate transport system permease protein